jgi:hypothetical protein
VQFYGWWLFLHQYSFLHFDSLQQLQLFIEASTWGAKKYINNKHKPHVGGYVVPLYIPFLAYLLVQRSPRQCCSCFLQCKSSLRVVVFLHRGGNRLNRVSNSWAGAGSGGGVARTAGCPGGAILRLQASPRVMHIMEI